MAKRVLSIEQLKELAQTNCYKVHAIAAKCGVSVRQFQRLTVLYTKKSPKDWMDEIRFQEAVLLLAAGHPVKDVAFRMGFNSSTPFCRKFKAKMGCSPDKFRGHLR